MHRFLLLFFSLVCFCGVVSAQQPIPARDSTVVRPTRVDTLKTTYVNPGKIAARRAVIGSLILPGLGQVRNGLNIYRGAKIAAIYTGFTFLAISYIDNNEQYHFFLDELLHRQKTGEPKDPLYARATDAQLIQAKDTYRRNREVVIFSFVAVYLVGAIDAYVDARLNYFDVDDDLSIRFSPTMINTNSMYGFSSHPGLKVSMRF